MLRKNTLKIRTNIAHLTGNKSFMHLTRKNMQDASRRKVGVGQIFSRFRRFKTRSHNSTVLFRLHSFGGLMGRPKLFLLETSSGIRLVSVWLCCYTIP